MKNTFLNRVSAERRVLTVINSHIPSNKQLTGLSSAALSQWRIGLSIEKTSKISMLLVDLAEQCQSLSDRSNETFMPIESTDSERIEAHLSSLSEEFGRYLKRKG